MDPERDRWRNLYEHYSQLEQAKAELLRATREAEQARREFDDWCEQATERVMRDIDALASARAEQFHTATGGRISVVYPSHPPIGLGEDGPFLTFMKLSLDATEVHLYSHRRPGALPAFHLVHTAPQDDDSRTNRPRSLVSQPGCFVVRGDEGYELREAEADGDGTLMAGRVITLDELVYRAFSVLVNEASRRR